MGPNYFSYPWSAGATVYRLRNVYSSLLFRDKLSAKPWDITSLCRLHIKYVQYCTLPAVFWLSGIHIKTYSLFFAPAMQLNRGKIPRP